MNSRRRPRMEAGVAGRVGEVGTVGAAVAGAGKLDKKC
jgi:hypothetical protein